MPAATRAAHLLLKKRKQARHTFDKLHKLGVRPMRMGQMRSLDSVLTHGHGWASQRLICCGSARPPSFPPVNLET